jgi:hypothetical protein
MDATDPEKERRVVYMTWATERHHHSLRVYDEKLWIRAHHQAVAEGIHISELVRRALWLYVSDPTAAAGMLRDHPEANVTPMSRRAYYQHMRAERAATRVTTPKGKKHPEARVETPDPSEDDFGLGF